MKRGKSRAAVFLLAALILVACGSQSAIPVTASVVDRYCRPVTEKDLVVFEQLPPNVPYGGGSTRLSKIKSDSQGHVKFFVDRRATAIAIYSPEDREHLHEMQQVSQLRRGTWGIAYLNGKPTTIDGYAPLRQSTRENPFYLYVMEDAAPLKEEAYDHNLIKMPFGKRIQRYMPSAFNRSPGRTVLLHWYLEGKDVYLQIVGVKDGGVREILDSDDLFAPFPHEGFEKSIVYKLQEGRFKKAFFVRDDSPNKFALLSFELLYDRSLKTAYATFYTHTMVLDSKEPWKRHSPKTAERPKLAILPIETCGGVLSRSPRGYYSSLNDTFLDYLKGTSPQRTPESMAYDELLETAANPDTSLQWIRENIRELPGQEEGGTRIDRRLSGRMLGLAEASLNNNGNVDQRLNYLFDVAKANDWKRLLERIAKDRRSPGSVLSRSFDEFGNNLIRHIVRNPNANDELLNRMLDRMLGYASIPLESELAPFASHRNASEKTLKRILDAYAENASAPDGLNNPYSLVILNLLKNPVLSYELLERLVLMIASYSDAAAQYYKLALAHPVADEVLKNKIRETVTADSERLRKQSNYREFDNLEAALSNEAGAMQPPKVPAKGAVKRRKLSARKMAADPENSPDVLRELFDRSEDGEVLKFLAANPSTPSDILHRIQDGDYVLTENLATERWFARSLFCNSAVDDERKRRLPYQDPETCKDIR